MTTDKEELERMRKKYDEAVIYCEQVLHKAAEIFCVMEDEVTEMKKQNSRFRDFIRRNNVVEEEKT